MRKTHWPARAAAGCLVTLSLVGVAFAAGGQGSQSDPLVTLSYLTQQTTPAILSQVDSMVDEREAELEAQLSAVVDRYVQEVEDALASSGGTAAQPGSGSASYEVVTLSAGQTIVGSAACEFLLRSGTALCVSDTSPGLVDMTAGTTLAGGGALIKGLDRRLGEKTGIPFHVAEDPLRAIARGTGIALKNINRFSFLMK